MFCVHPVIVDEEPDSTASTTTSFAGVYDTLALPDVHQGRRHASWSCTRSTSTSRPPRSPHRHRRRGPLHASAARFSTNPKPWDLDVEADYQFGEFGDGDISAWIVRRRRRLHVRRRRSRRRAVPRLRHRQRRRRPDRRRPETFNQLFPLGHAYFGYIDVIGRQNIIDLHPGVELTLLKDKPYAKKVSLRADYHLFWRAERRRRRLQRRRRRPARRQRQRRDATSAARSTCCSTGRSTATWPPTSATATSSPATSSRTPARAKTSISSTRRVTYTF